VQLRCSRFFYVGAHFQKSQKYKDPSARRERERERERREREREREIELGKKTQNVLSRLSYTPGALPC
jgi:hypothetical protein